MTVKEMIEELTLVENKDLEVMIGMNGAFIYLDPEDMGITTFGIPCDEFGMPLEGSVEEGPTVFTMIVSHGDDDYEESNDQGDEFGG